MENKKKIILFRLLLTTIFASVILSGCTSENEQGEYTEEEIIEMVQAVPSVIAEEKIGGKYNATVLTVRTEYEGGEDVYKGYQIEYTKDGTTLIDDMPFFEKIRPALEWIRSDTPEDATILSWWDYGNSINGFTGRDVVVNYATIEELETMDYYNYQEPQKKAEMKARANSQEKMRDVSRVLTTPDQQEAIEIMEKYGATHLLILHSRDIWMSHVFFENLGETPLDPESEEMRATVLGKATQGIEIEGFDLVYSDDNVNVYAISIG